MGTWIYIYIEVSVVPSDLSCIPLVVPRIADPDGNGTHCLYSTTALADIAQKVQDNCVATSTSSWDDDADGRMGEGAKLNPETCGHNIAI